MKIYYIIIFFLMISCNSNNDVNNLNVRLNPVDTIFSVQSKYFAHVFDLKKIDNGFSFIDRKQQSAYVIDENLNSIRTLGTEGKGPTEFIGLISLIHDNSRILTIDSEAKKLVTYNQDYSFLSTSHIDGITVLHTRIVKHNDFIYGNSLPPKPIVKINIENGDTLRFGNPFITNDYAESFARSHRHVLSYKDKIISVWYSEPIIEVYNKHEKMINKFEFFESPFLKSRLNYINSEHNKNGQNRFNTYSLFVDTYINDDNLYILFSNNEGENKQYSCNDLIVFDINSDQIKKKMLVKLNGARTYSSFCAWDVGILAFDNFNNVFHIYNKRKDDYTLISSIDR